MGHLLVTGFGPFPTMPRNPSAALAAAVADAPRWRLHTPGARCRVLTTSYGALATELDPALGEGPAAVLMVGVAGRSRRIRVERRATGRRSTLFPDVAGDTAGRPDDRGAPRERRTTVPPPKVLRAIRASANPARISRDAGRYLCNASYFRALAEPVPVLFVHIPKPRPPRPAARLRRRQRPEAALRDALVAIGLDMLRQARVAARRPPR